MAGVGYRHADGQFIDVVQLAELTEDPGADRVPDDRDELPNSLPPMRSAGPATFHAVTSGPAGITTRLRPVCFVSLPASVCRSWRSRWSRIRSPGTWRSVPAWRCGSGWSAGHVRPGGVTAVPMPSLLRVLAELHAVTSDAPYGRTDRGRLGTRAADRSGAPLGCLDLVRRGPASYRA